MNVDHYNKRLNNIQFAEESQRNRSSCYKALPTDKNVLDQIFDKYFHLMIFISGAENL